MGGRLGQGDEAVGEKQAEVRVVPPDQGLDPDHPAAAQVGLGLVVVEDDLAALDRSAEL
jgi:hypothetical protein